MKTASSSLSEISSPQRAVKPVRDLVGGVSFPQRDSASTVSTMQRLVKAG